MQQKSVRALTQSVKENIEKVFVGRETALELMLAAIMARGHVLIEDVPGTGKTILAKALAKSLACRFSRIQFTPDLLPSDVTGLSVFNARTTDFEFKPGPVFTNILLADEINRATPRTQSALLECMEERQVTQDGVTRPLAEPFIVIATQNPIETQGTFPLPEAQLDRFLMRFGLGYPSADGAMRIMGRFIGGDPLARLEPCVTGEDVLSAQQVISETHISEPVMQYIIAICEASRNYHEVQMGASPRGMLALARSCCALAMIRGRDFVTPDDVKALAAPVLSHRLILRGQYGQPDQSEAVIGEILKKVTVPTEKLK